MNDKRSEFTTCRGPELRAGRCGRPLDPMRQWVSRKGRLRRSAESRLTSGEAPCEIRFSWPACLLAASIVVGGIGACFLCTLLFMEPASCLNSHP